MNKMQLGRLQHKIMTVLWRRGRANAREITADLNQGEAVAHSTVQTLLRKLEDKGSVSHETEDRTFVYFPLVEEKSVTRSATRELIDRVFGGNAAGLVAHLLSEEKIDPAEFKQLKRLLNKKPGQGESS